MTSFLRSRTCLRRFFHLPGGAPEAPGSLAFVRAVCVVGARPNFMKITPVIAALERRRVEVVLVHTGQHYDRSMSTVFFDELGLRAPDRWLDVGSGTHAEQTAGVMSALEPVIDELRPDVVVVVGDVNSTMAAALVAAKSPARLAHVEAGLRSRDWTMPEEVNRLVTDSVSDDLLAPSQDAVDNLLTEGHPADRIHLVGNVMIDTLLANLERAKTVDVMGRLGVAEGSYGLVTLHRPANVDDPDMLAQLLKALGEVAARCPLLLPAHPRVAPHLAAADVPAGVRGHRAPRVPGVPGAGGRRPPGSHRFGRSTGGDDGPRRTLPHPQRHDRATGHHHGRHERARRA